MVTQHELDAWLKEGIGAAKAGQYEKARFRLLDVVEQDQTNEAAWYWLYYVFHRHDDKRICLENLVMINPNNEWAHQELYQYLTAEEFINQQAYDSIQDGINLAHFASRTLILRLVIAFWVGISVIFLGGGIIAAGEWLVVGVRTEAFSSYITTTQLFELIIAIIFIIIGIVGVNVAVGLYSRSVIGFYGSLLLGLGLLLIGPIISLIATPPNYLTLMCTGSVSGVIVLLTLFSEMR